MRWAAIVFGVALALFAARSAIAARSIIYDGPNDIANTRSLLQAIDDAHAAGRTLHIIFVHGIRATGGESLPFVNRLRDALDGSVVQSKPVSLRVGAWPKSATMAGDPNNIGVDRTAIWSSEPIWDAHQPYVVRSIITAGTGKVTVDEINYWPLLWPLKCRFLLVPEHDLSGDDKTDLGFCVDQGWITKLSLDRIEAKRPKSGGGALVNAKLKQQIMNWGLSDAVIAIGPLRAYLNKTIDLACEYALKDGPGDEYVIVSESLGSFVVLDAFAEQHPAVRQVVLRSADLYFFANQFALLELARIEGLPEASTPRTRALIGSTLAMAPRAPSPLAALQEWANPSGAADRAFVAADVTAGRPKQIIAFSDPSDLLTFKVPPIKGATVINIYDRQGFDLFGLVADPVKAHTGHVGNDAVWKLLLSKRH